MTSPTDNTRDRLLERLATGTLDSASPEVRKAFDSDPTLAREWEELSAMQRALDLAAASERQDLAEAKQLEADEGDAVVELVFERLGYPGAGRPRQRSRLFVTAAAIAAVVLVAVWLATRGDRTDDASQPELPGMLGDPVAGETVMDRADLEFVWTDADAPAGSTFRLEVFAGDSVQDRDRLTEVSDLTDRRWVPSDAQRNAWPERITWRVEYRAIDGSLARPSHTIRLR